MVVILAPLEDAADVNSVKFSSSLDLDEMELEPPPLPECIPSPERSRFEPPRPRLNLYM